MKPTDFANEFDALIRKAVNANCPIMFIVGTLEMTKIELANMSIARSMAAQQQQAAQMMADNTPKIITPTTN